MTEPHRFIRGGRFANECVECGEWGYDRAIHPWGEWTKEQHRMSDDKLADAIGDVDNGSHWPNSSTYDEITSIAGYVADWLRSPEGIAALAADETIRRGIERDLSGYTYGFRDGAAAERGEFGE